MGYTNYSCDAERMTNASRISTFPSAFPQGNLDGPAMNAQLPPALTGYGRPLPSPVGRRIVQIAFARAGVGTALYSQVCALDNLGAAWIMSTESGHNTSGDWRRLPDLPQPI